jgi:hypothetical protein
VAHTAVFLMNLGGPRSLAEVEPYLYELFSDPLVVTAPFGPLRPLFAKLVSKTRAPSSAEKYALIGGKSPIVEGTEAQAQALAAALGAGWTCHLAMRCGHPNTEEGVREALAAGADRAVALPLYPQYANATTKSSLLELRRVWPKDRPLAEICTWHDHAGYLDASAAALAETLARVPAADRDYYVARELAQMVPLWGQGTYESLRARNAWMADFQPNAGSRWGAVEPVRLGRDLQRERVSLTTHQVENRCESIGWHGGEQGRPCFGPVPAVR